MSRNVFVVILFLVLVLFSFHAITLASTTGKIAGQVVDKKTKEPIIAVNVIIENTFLGAATDDEGYYTILNVPPGTHVVKALSIGYAEMTVSDVRVRIDQTTRVDFELAQEAMTGDTVVIFAERDLVKDDVSTSVIAFQGDEVEELAISNINEAVELQAGIEEGLEIRGAQADEALFQIDGITLRDPRNNEPISRVAMSAVKEISIERGGFNAEYGHVRSGIINVVTKEGSKTGYQGTITLKASDPAPKHFGISPFNKNSMWMRPYMDPEVCWTGTENGAWDAYEQRQYPQFDGWNEISRRLCEDDDRTNDLSPIAAKRVWEWEHRRRPQTDQPDYNIDAGFGGPVPFISKQLGNLRFFTSYRREREMLLIPLSRDDYVDYDLSLRLNSDISPSTKLQLTGLVGKSYNVAINADDRQFYNMVWGRNGVQFWLPTDYMRSAYEIAKVTDEQRPGRIFCDSWYSRSTINHTSIAAKLTHSLSQNTFLEASVEHLNSKYTTGPVRPRSKAQVVEIIPGVFLDEAPNGYSSDPSSGISGMFFGGHTSTSRDSSNISSTTLKCDITSQVNFTNLVKAGFEFNYYDLHLNYGEINPFFGGVNFVREFQSPIRFALYAQDKIEALGFIANLGLRLDYSNANTDWVVVDSFNEDFYSSQYDPAGTYDSEDAKADVSISPRLGISHPITKNSKIFFNYGHFKQLPAYEQIFRVSRDAAGSMQNYGDPNLALAKTVSYELGYDHVLFDNYLVQLTAYYHDITDQQAFTTYYNAKGTVTYNLTNNDSYEDIRGFEITLRKTGGRWWSGFANYTYHVNTLGAFGRARVYQDVSEQRIYDQTTSNLYQQKPTPRPFARGVLTFYTPHDYGPKTIGMNPLGDWKLNIIGNWQAGEWITWNPNNERNIINNLQVTDDWNVDLRLNKKFVFNKFDVNLFLEITNVFNFKKLSGASFWDNNDQIYYFESLHLPESRAYNNITGDDRPGDYRKAGVTYQPVLWRNTIRYEDEVGEDGTEYPMDTGDPGAIYYNKETKNYVEYIDGDEPFWQTVEKSRMDKILEDKAYIDMPNQTSFNFLNPRQIFFGITTSFRLN